jgi:hypothetical protein
MDTLLKHTEFLSEYQNLIYDYSVDYDRRLKAYGKNINLIGANSLKEIEENFERFANPYRKVLIEKIEDDAVNSWGFSIFKIVKSKRPEEHIHTPLLYELLDTQGSHGQKDLFYKLFVETLLPQSIREKFINDNYADYLIKQEEWVKSEIGKGEVDITIKSRNPKKRFAIIIENKWKSPDSCLDQLYKYYDCYTVNYGYNNDNLLLVYLTINGNDPSWVSVEFNSFLQNAKNKNYFPISYKKHILKWLASCVENCQSEKVRTIIVQYKNYLKWNL